MSLTTDSQSMKLASLSLQLKSERSHSAVCREMGLHTGQQWARFHSHYAGQSHHTATASYNRGQRRCSSILSMKGPFPSCMEQTGMRKYFLRCCLFTVQLQMKQNTIQKASQDASPCEQPIVNNHFTICFVLITDFCGQELTLTRYLQTAQHKTLILVGVCK